MSYYKTSSDSSLDDAMTKAFQTYLKLAIDACRHETKDTENFIQGQINVMTELLDALDSQRKALDAFSETYLTGPVPEK